MLTQKMQDALNEQIREELYSSYLYLSMSAHFEAQNLAGFAHWMSVQSQEEYGHAMRFFGYIQDRSSRVALKAIQQPPASFGTPLSVMEQSLQHEQHITGCIHDLYAAAQSENDYATMDMLKWFVNEQVEEEKNVSQIVEQLKMIGEQGAALFMMDHQLGARGE